MEDVNSTIPLFTNDAVVFGLLMGLLMLVFKTSSMSQCKGFYRIIPALLPTSSCISAGVILTPFS